MRVVEFGSFLHSYASSFFLVVSSAPCLSVSGNALNCYPTCLFSIHPFLSQTPTKFDNVPESYNWKKTHPSSQRRPINGPLILLHPVSAGPWRIVPFTSSNWKCIHYEPNALGSQIPVRFSRALPIYIRGSFGRS